MRVLTLDAATAVCSAGLVEDGVVLDHLEAEDVAALPGLVERLFATHGRRLDRVAVTVGPGSFTGLRAAIALAHGIALASDAPAAGVTLGAALAADGVDWTVIDSKRGRVFLEREGAVESLALNALPLPGAPIRIGGDLAAAVAAALRARGASVDVGPTRPSPAGIASAPVRPALPLYVEPPAARPGPAGRPAPR